MFIYLYLKMIKFFEFTHTIYSSYYFISPLGDLDRDRGGDRDADGDGDWCGDAMGGRGGD